MYRDGSFLLVIVHVDDGAIATNDRALADEMMAFLRQTIEIRDYEEMTGMLGLEITRGEEGGIRVTANRLIEKSLIDLGLTKVPGANTPYIKDDIKSENLQLLDEEDKNAAQLVTANRQRIGVALYVNRFAVPELGYALCEVARFQEKPSKQIEEATVRIMAYLSRTQEQENAITFHKKKDGEVFQLQVYTDATWGSDETRRSHSGSVTYLAGGVITTMSQSQKAVALSSTEAEIYAIGTALQSTRHLGELVDHMQHLYRLAEAGATNISEVPPSPTRTKIILKTDSKSACMAMMAEKVSKLRKHIGVRWSYIHDNYIAGAIGLIWISREINPADGLCKKLSFTDFKSFKKILYDSEEHRSYD
jgi:hypothetical protein